MRPDPIKRLRSLLFAPAVREDLLMKLPRSAPDGVVIDCEDATPVEQKAAGRLNAIELAPKLIEQTDQVFVRINPPGTQWFIDDIRYGLASGIAGVVVPMVETIAGLDRCAKALAEAHLGHIGIIAGLETGLGVADARELLQHHQVVAGYFGAEDYIADLGGVRTRNNIEVVYARSQVALAGRLAQKPVLDQIVANFKDNDRFKGECGEARAMGFAGKLCIHPAQVELAHAGFTPSVEEVERAHRLLKAYEQAVNEGIAAIDFEGQMVDEPLAVQARQILKAAGES